MNEDNEIESLAPWLVILLTLIGGGLRVFMLGRYGLSWEESFSIWLGNQSVGNMLQWVGKIDLHPPLYYLLLHYWIALKGDLPDTVRLLSALFGTATIPFIYLIGKRMSGVLMGLVAALIFTLSPFNIRFAQEARMYTLLTFNAAVAIYALVRLLTDSRCVRPIGSQFREYLHVWRTSSQPEPDSEGDFSYARKTRDQTGWRAWIYRHHWSPIQTIETDLAWVAFIVFSAATLLTHNTAVLFPLATNIFVLSLMLYQKLKKSGTSLTFNAPSFRNWLIAQIGILLLWSPWIRAFTEQARRVYQELWIAKPSGNTVIQAFTSFLNEFVPGQASTEKLIWVLYTLVLCLGLVYYWKKFSRFFFLAVLIVIPFLGELLVSTRRPIFYDRTLIWTTIPLFLVLAAGIVRLRFNLLIIVMVAIFATTNLFSTGDYYRSMPVENWEKLAGNVANFVQNDDLILFNATWVQIPFDYYFKTYEDLYHFQVDQHGIPVDLFESGVMEPKMTESDIPRLVSLLNGRNRVWLVYNHYEVTDPNGLIPQTLASKMKLIYQRDYYGLQVQFYAVP